jgi:hypothetical protein
MHLSLEAILPLRQAPCDKRGVIFMRLPAALFGAALAIATPYAAKAAPAFLDFTVTSQAALDLAGITYSASGGASVVPSAPPVVRMTVTGSSAAQIDAITSVVDADLGAATISLTDFKLSLLPDPDLLVADLTLTPDVGAPTLFNNFLVALVEADGDVVLSDNVVSLLSDLGINGRGFIVASLTVVEADPVPAPAALALFGLGLALLGAPCASRRPA